MTLASGDKAILRKRVRLLLDLSRQILNNYVYTPHTTLMLCLPYSEGPGLGTSARDIRTRYGRDEPGKINSSLYLPLSPLDSSECGTFTCYFSALPGLPATVERRKQQVEDRKDQTYHTQSTYMRYRSNIKWRCFLCVAWNMRHPSIY